MTDTAAFPTELTEREAAAPFLDTDAMLAELNDIVVAGQEDGDDPDGDTEGGDDPSGGDGGETEGTETDTQAPPAAVVPPGYIEFEGQQYPIDEVKALLTLNQRMKDQPDVAEKIHAALVPATTVPERPAWVDDDDPRSLAMYADMQRIEAEAKAARAQVAQVTERDRRAHTVDSFRSAISTFKAAHPGLSDAQIAQVADMTGRANIIEGLEKTEGSLTAAFEKGMEMTLWATPQLRSLILAEQSTTVPDNDKRKGAKAKMGALAPGGGGSTRTQTAPKPKTREELIDAMLSEVRAGMQND